jgi:hypothetical protein
LVHKRIWSTSAASPGRDKVSEVVVMGLSFRALPSWRAAHMTSNAKFVAIA